jgi:hypothetical protein
MINRTGLGELVIGSSSDHRYDNCKCHPLYVFVEWNGTMSFVSFTSFHVSFSHKNELVFCT